MRGPARNGWLLQTGKCEEPPKGTIYERGRFKREITVVRHSG